VICGRGEEIEVVLARLADGTEVPRCLACDGPIKPATVSFGQSLPPDVIRQALEYVRRADCLLAIGSSLQVRPAADLVDVAKRHGAAVVIATRSPTPYDLVADVKLDADLGECLTRLARRVIEEEA
jgi:NAD-dependent deacetylase